MINRQPFISIIILVAASRKTDINRCVLSILSSSYKKYEVIIINNTDEESFLRELKFPDKVKIITLHANSGVTGYNVGFSIAKGDGILIIDDDCQIFPDTLEKIARSLVKLPQSVGIIATNVINPLTNSYHHNMSYVRNRPLYTFPGGASVFRSTMRQQVGFYDPSFFLWLHEDDFAIRMLQRGFTIYFASDITINHYDTVSRFRPRLAFFVFRNKAWLNIKHFSLWFFPILIFRDLIWLTFFPFRTRSVRTFFIGLYGYLIGYLTFIVPLLNRHVISGKLQKEFLSFYYSYRH